MGAQARDAKNEARPGDARPAGGENSRVDAPSEPREAAPASARRKRAREPSDGADADGADTERPADDAGTEPAKAREPAALPKRARAVAPKDDAPTAEGAQRLGEEQPEAKVPEKAESQPTASTHEKPAGTETQKDGGQKPPAALSGAGKGEQREEPEVAPHGTASSAKPAAEGEKLAIEGEGPTTEGKKPATEGQKPFTRGEKPATEGKEPAPEGEKPANEGEKPAEKPAAASTPAKSGFSAFTSSASPFAGVKNTGSSGTSTPSKLGFGAFASTSSPFIKTQATGETEAKERGTDWPRQGGEELASKPQPQDNVVRKRSIQLPETDIKTGEEEEKTVHSVRAKLFHMASDRSWKERGMGVLKINVSTAADSPARLVMRADGVLRVILNVALFPGMLCEQEQEKYIRIVAMEAEGLSHFAIRLANQGEAAALLHALREHIPVRAEAAAE